MKFIVLFSIIFGCLFANAQKLIFRPSLNVFDTLEIMPGRDAESVAYLVNNSGKTAAIRWVFETYNGSQSEYSFSMCDIENCYQADFTIREVTLNDGDSTHMKFGINAKCKPGNASASLRAWIADDSVSSLIRFSYNVLLKQGSKCLSSVEDKSIDYAQIFPNPCSDYIDLKNFSSDLHQAVAKIFDVSGKLVLLQNIGSNLRINTRSLEEGYYILQIQQENNVSLQKRFIKK